LLFAHAYSSREWSRREASDIDGSPKGEASQ